MTPELKAALDEMFAKAGTKNIVLDPPPSSPFRPSVIKGRTKPSIAFRPSSGPGTELTKLIHSLTAIKIVGCNGCTALAAQMDAKGPDWCLENIALIEAAMIDNAKKKGKIFTAITKLAGMANNEWTPRRLIERAVENARQQIPPSSPPPSTLPDTCLQTSQSPS